MLLVVLSVVLSGVVAFGVARYTVDQNDRVQRKAAVQRKLSAAYLPLLSTQAQVLTCVDRGGCSEAELLRADRAANATTVAAGGQGSDKVANLAAAALVSIGIGVEHRLRGKRPSTALLDRAGGQFAALQVQISEELDPG